MSLYRTVTLYVLVFAFSCSSTRVVNPPAPVNLMPLSISAPSFELGQMDMLVPVPPPPSPDKIDLHFEVPPIFFVYQPLGRFEGSTNLVDWYFVGDNRTSAWATVVRDLPFQFFRFVTTSDQLQ